MPQTFADIASGIRIVASPTGCGVPDVLLTRTAGPEVVTGCAIQLNRPTLRYLRRRARITYRRDRIVYGTSPAISWGSKSS